LIFLVGTPGDDRERVIRQRPLQRFGSSHGARIQTPYSSALVRITGIALESTASPERPIYLLFGGESWEGRAARCPALCR